MNVRHVTGCLLVLCCLTPPGALGQGAVRPPERQRLDVQGGRWSEAGQMREDPTKPFGPISGGKICKWAAGRFTAICEEKTGGASAKLSEMARWRYATPVRILERSGAQNSQQPPRDGRARSIRRRVLGGIVGGVGGFFGGMFLGAAIEGDRCGCDDPGLTGALIGAPIGAAAGGVLGYKRLF